MPLLGFTVLKDKLLDGSKCQTIRRPRKRYDFKLGDKLYIYWRPRTKYTEKLGESVITNIRTTRIRYLTQEDAIKDGFRDEKGMSAKGHLYATLRRLHPEIHEDAFLDCFVNIITFKPLNSSKEKVKT